MSLLIHVILAVILIVGINYCLEKFSLPMQTLQRPPVLNKLFPFYVRMLLSLQKKKLKLTTRPSKYLTLTRAGFFTSYPSGKVKTTFTQGLERTCFNML